MLVFLTVLSNFTFAIISLILKTSNCWFCFLLYLRCSLLILPGLTFITLSGLTKFKLEVMRWHTVSNCPFTFVGSYKFMAKNFQLFEFGRSASALVNEKVLKSIIIPSVINDIIESHFHLVLIADYFYESMVLLKVGTTKSHRKVLELKNDILNICVQSFFYDVVHLIHFKLLNIRESIFTVKQL